MKICVCMLFFFFFSYIALSTLSNVYLIKDNTLFLLYGRNDLEKMTSRKYEYIKGINGHSEIALYVDTFEEVDEEYAQAIRKGAISVLEPTTEP